MVLKWSVLAPDIQQIYLYPAFLAKTQEGLQNFKNSVII